MCGVELHPCDTYAGPISIRNRVWGLLYTVYRHETMLSSGTSELRDGYTDVFCGEEQDLRNGVEDGYGIVF